MCCAISSCAISSGFAATPPWRADEQANAATAAALVNTLATTRSRFPTRAGDIDASFTALVANARAAGQGTGENDLGRQCGDRGDVHLEDQGRCAIRQGPVQPVRLRCTPQRSPRKD